MGRQPNRSEDWPEEHVLNLLSADKQGQAVDDKLSFLENRSVLLGQDAVRSLLHLVLRQREAPALERLELSVQLLHFVQPDLHPDEAGDLGPLRLFLAVGPEHLNEALEAFREPHEDLMDVLGLQLALHNAHIFVHSRVDSIDKVSAIWYPFLLEDALDNPVFLLIVAVFDLSDVFERFNDQIVLVVHVRHLELLESELDHGEAGHRDTELLLCFFAYGDEFIERKHGLRLCIDDLNHAIHDKVHTLHHALFVTLYV